MSVFPVRNSGFEIHQLVEDESLVALGRTHLDEAEPDRFDGRRGHQVEEDLDAAEEVEIVVGLLCGLGGRYAVDEIQRSDPGFDLVGREDLVGNLVVEAGRGIDAGLRNLCIRLARKRNASQSRRGQQRAAAEHDIAAIDAIEGLEGIRLLLRQVDTCHAHTSKWVAPRLRGVCAAPDTFCRWGATVRMDT